MLYDSYAKLLSLFVFYACVDACVTGGMYGITKIGYTQVRARSQRRPPTPRRLLTVPTLRPVLSPSPSTSPGASHARSSAATAV